MSARSNVTDHSEISARSGTTGHSEPRYEFRVFATELRDRIARLSPSALRMSMEVSSSEIYFVPRQAVGTNIKVREGKLEVKRLDDRRCGFERWRPVCSIDLPVSPARLADLAGPDIAFAKLDSCDPHVSLDDLVSLAEQSPDLSSVSVRKERIRFVHDRGGLSEHVKLSFLDQQMHSVAVEAAEFEAAVGLQRQAGLEEFANQGYPDFLRAFLFAK